MESAFWKEGDYFVAQCLNIDVSSFATSREEALKNLDEAVSLYLEDEAGEVMLVESPEIAYLTVKYG